MSIKSLLTKKNFKISDFVKNLSEADNKFKLQNEAAYHINELINDEIAKESSSAIQDFHVTPLYILKVLEKWINDKTLLFSPDGYSLSKALSSEDLPNSDEIDSFYHSILDGYDTKWQRLLESAAIIGNKFNAEVLSHVWGYELLSVLDFLEKAESDNLITDLSEEDNIYEFKDKRIISAINNYFSTSRENGTKQIVIEYNKRYLNQQKHVIENPHLYPIEDLLMVVRRAIPLLKNNEIKQKIQLLFSNLIVRMLGNKQHHELNAFIDHIEQKEMSSLSNLLRGLNAIANIDNGFDKVLKKGSEIQNSIYAHSFENELRLIALLYKKERLKEENNQKTVLNIEEINYLKDRILNHYKGDELVIITALFMQNVDLAQKDKLSLLEHIKNRTDNLPYLNIYLEIIEFHVKNKSNISDKVKNEITKDLINKSSDIGNKHLLKTCLQLRIKTLSSDLKKHDEAINEFKSFSSKLLDNTLNIHWIETCLKLMNGSSGDLYLETHKSDYENQIKIIEDFIYKRYDEHAFNRLIKLFSEAKLKFLKQANQKDLLKNYKEKYLEIIKKELGESHPYYDRFKES